MSESSEAGNVSRRQNPLIWIALVVIGLIVFVFVSGDRGQSMVSSSPETKSGQSDSSATGNIPVPAGEIEQSVGTIDRSSLVPPGMRAREYIAQLRAAGEPYPLDEAFAKAGEFLAEGSLADAHLVYFFAAREDHLPAIMKMAEMSDPTLFRAEDSLLDDADIVQAYKWYQKAAEMNHADAVSRIEGLQQWASARADAGDFQAQQFLLNFQ